MSQWRTEQREDVGGSEFVSVEEQNDTAGVLFVDGLLFSGLFFPAEDWSVFGGGC